MNRDGQLQIEPRLHDLGDGFSVRRLLPFRQRRHVGPFVFFDHIGPVDLAPGRGMDVRPHPHIGLATVTYLFDGAIRHRDSLGSDRVIRPGDVNWMTAGRGIVHSERTPTLERAAGHRLHGLQTWVALPREQAEVPPEFLHHEADSLPQVERDGVQLRVIAGSAFGMQSPVQVFAPTLYVEVRMRAGTRLSVPAEHAERAIYVLGGELQVDAAPLPPQRMLVVDHAAAIELSARSAVHLFLCGGAPLDGERVLWWNFVASDRARIERAKADWLAQRLGQVPGESEFIPLPEY
ncbi:MAG: pirin family protein [Dokdonella sp.]|uniref:pirin family protein n=1 Tax=Dokdonella sp. TaxID=2291710 RepID=UPI0025BA08BD|nr:pirin family protein [Dokdonella sp.]MBZ0222119.1 pirin family protein [Dokdonella sp.]MCC7254754.1 pirin family protein [Dokdonella sp.]